MVLVMAVVLLATTIIATARLVLTIRLAHLVVATAVVILVCLHYSFCVVIVDKIFIGKSIKNTIFADIFDLCYLLLVIFIYLFAFTPI